VTAEFDLTATATKLMTAYTRMSARGYMMEVMKPLVEGALASGDCEINPNNTSQESADANLHRLIDLVRLFMTTIFASLDRVPM
jgi:hypothetical protein